MELYINQLVSASLASPVVGLLINQTASLHGPNFTASANITFEALPGAQVLSKPLHVCNPHQAVNPKSSLYFCHELHNAKLSSVCSK